MYSNLIGGLVVLAVFANAEHLGRCYSLALEAHSYRAAERICDAFALWAERAAELVTEYADEDALLYGLFELRPWS